MKNEYFLELHQELPSDEPVRNKYTRKAYQILPSITTPTILDIGCGPGVQTLELARLSKGTIIAIDINESYLEELRKRAKQSNLDKYIIIKKQSMLSLDFPDETFDIIWAEGSIFAIGFTQGLRAWKQFIKPKGFLVVHEMAYLKENPPQQLKKYWKQMYSGLTTIEQNKNYVQECGYTLLDYFPLPKNAWWDLYYCPLEKRIRLLKKKYQNNNKALAVFTAEEQEITLYKKYSSWFGSAFFIMQKND